jgi:hypothetical protein
MQFLHNPFLVASVLESSPENLEQLSYELEIEKKVEIKSAFFTFISSKIGKLFQRISFFIG